MRRPNNKFEKSFNIIAFHSSFDGENKTWTEIKSMNVARCYASATVANGYIYVAGGRDTYKTCTNTVELYDPKNDEWLEIAPMTAPRAAFALVNLKGFLYALGGSQFIERYDPWKTRWTKVSRMKRRKSGESSLSIIHFVSNFRLSLSKIVV